jgi:hypothetical protein
MHSHQGSSWAGILIVGAIVVVVVGFVILPGLFSSSHPYSSERNSSTTLKTLSSAEADFRANDRDWNHVTDFWTANVSGLYTMTSAAVKGAEANNTMDPSIKLIELSVASADADGEFYSAGGENLPLSSFAVPSAKAGYWFAGLTADLSVEKASEGVYAQDTKGTPLMGRVHHTARFGFVAIPDSQAAGKYVFIVNENNTIFRTAATGPCKQGTEAPPGLRNVSSAYRNWPDDNSLKAAWNKLD